MVYACMHVPVCLFTILSVFLRGKAACNNKKVKFPVKFRLYCNMWCQIHWSPSEFFILFNRRALAYYGNFQNWQNVDVYVWLCLQEGEDGSLWAVFLFCFPECYLTAVTKPYSFGFLLVSALNLCIIYNLCISCAFWVEKRGMKKTNKIKPWDEESERTPSLFPAEWWGKAILRRWDSRAVHSSKSPLAPTVTAQWGGIKAALSTSNSSPRFIGDSWFKS